MAKFYPLGRAESLDSEGEIYEDSSPQIEITEEENQIVVNFSFPGFDLTDVEKEVDNTLMDFKEVGISGAGFLSESGKPLLPSFGRFIKIPLSFNYELDVEYGKRHDFSDILITPAQEDTTDSPESTKLEYDSKAYSDEGLYPREMVEAGSIQLMDNYKALPLYIRPVQYSAANKMLRAYEQIKVVIKLIPSDELDEEEQEQFFNADVSIRQEAYGNLLLNPRRSTIGRGLDPRVVSRPTFPVRRGPELLIIYDDGLKKPAEKLSLWKNQRGLLSETIPISKIGNDVSKIKTHVRNRRKAWFSRLRYVLLFGDVKAIVTEQTAGNTTDHYYYTSKDASSDNDCILPWVSGGRIPVDNSKTANKIVDQIIRYEKEPPRDPNYYKRMTFAAYFQDRAQPLGNAERAYIKTMESIRKHMVTLGFDIDRVYVSDTPNPVKYLDGTTVPADVRAAIVDADTATLMMVSDTSEGQLLVGHRDHGGPSGWAHPSFNNNHLDAIVSQYPSIFYSINCLTGQYDADPSDSFAEKILALDGGAPSLIAASELSGTWRNDSMMKAMFDSLWPGVIPTFPGSTVSYGVKHNRLGDILNYAKSYLMVAHGTNAGVKDHLEIYHVIGDPTLQLWCKEPKPVKLRVRVRNRRLYVTTNICPVNSMITIWKDKKLLRRINLTSTMISIPLRELLGQPISTIPVPRRRILSVCFSAPNHLFAKAYVRI
jgi:hypothetical protein